MIIRYLIALTVVFISGCATAPSVIDAKNDPSSPGAAEGSTRVHPITLNAEAPDTSTMEDQKQSGDKMPRMDMPSMNMNSTKTEQNKGESPK